MSNIDYVFKRLISIKSGEYSTLINFNFKISSFHEDWLNEKSRNWKGVLIEINLLIRTLIEEFEESKNYTFTNHSDFIYTYPGTIVQDFKSNIFPKLCDDFDDFVLRNKEELLIWKRHEWYENYLTPLKSLSLLISDCLVEYEIHKDSEIYNPSFKYYDRIPFNGSERALSAFANLLVQGGFILAKEAVPNNLLPTDDLQRTIFKNHVLKKQELADRLSKLFYTVDYSEKINLNEPDKINLKSKMQNGVMKEISESDKQKFRDGFAHIKTLIDKYL